MNTPSRMLTSQGVILQNGRPKAIWLWDATLVASRPTDVLTKLTQGRFTDIFVPYDTAKASIAQYQYFIRNAYNLDISVHALDGDATWALTTGRGYALNVIDNINAYNLQSDPYARFEGVHLDVEPHGLNGANGYPNTWNTDKVGTIDQWITNSDVWVPYGHKYGLIVGGAFTHWLDDSVSAPTPVVYGAKKVSELLIDRYDYYAIMSYNDSGSGIVGLANTEVAYATTPKIFVSVETIQTPPASVTFYEEGYVAVNQAIKYVDDNLQNAVGYKGVAVHDFTQYEQFLQPHMRKNTVRVQASIRQMVSK